MNGLKEKCVCVVGCGGLGGYVAEYLIRLGIGHIIAVDGDRFSESNLNRQILCTMDNIGEYKAEEVKLRAERINMNVSVTAVNEFINAENAENIIKSADVVIDALDSMDARKLLFEACKKSEKTMIHGAIGTESMQIAVIPPNKSFPRMEAETVHADEVLSYIPAICAGYEVSECRKMLMGEKSELYGKMLCIDLSSNEQIVIEI